MVNSIIVNHTLYEPKIQLNLHASNTNHHIFSKEWWEFDISGLIIKLIKVKCNLIVYYSIVIGFPLLLNISKLL